MDIRSLHLLLETAQLGSFAAVARKTKLDPSTVSRLVTTVEAELGFRLFQRSTRHLTLTEAGSMYVEQIAPALEQIASAGETGSGAQGALSGTVRLTCSTAFAQVCIVPLLGPLRDAYPDITLELIPSDDQVDLIEGGYDLAIRLAPAPKGDLMSTKLCETRYHVCAAPAYLEKIGHPARPKTLENLNCVRMALPDLRNSWVFRDPTGSEETVTISGTLAISSALALREAVRAGLGPGLLTDWLVADDLKASKLVDIFPTYKVAARSFDTGAWLLYPSRRFLPQRTRAIIDFLKAAF